MVAKGKRKMRARTCNGGAGERYNHRSGRRRAQSACRVSGTTPRLMQADHLAAPHTRMKNRGTSRDLTDALTMTTAVFHALTRRKLSADSVRGCHGSQSLVVRPKKPHEGHALDVAAPRPRCSP